MAKPRTTKKDSKAPDQKAAYERERVRRLHDLIKALGAWPAFCGLPKADRDLIERRRSPRPYIAEDPGIPKECVQYFREVLDTYLATESFPLGETGYSITAREYFSSGLVLVASAMNMETTGHPLAAQWSRALSQLLEFHEKSSSEGPLYHLLLVLRVSSWVFNEVEHGWYVPKMEIETPRDRIAVPIFCFHFRFFPPEHRRFILDGKPRTCFRVHAYSEDFLTVSPCLLSTSLLPGQENRPARELAVYIQKHAMHRIEERMAPYPMHIRDHVVSKSIHEPVVRPLGADTCLIELRDVEHRVGYLVGEVVDDAVVLRTFLFITQSGTPEGDRFNEALRIGNYEKRWFELDRLSGFAHSDLCEDPRFQALMEQCGLTDLTRFVLEELPQMLKPDVLRQKGEQVRKILMEQSRFTVAEEEI